MAEKIIAIVDNSAGNESVGEMWKETKIFEQEATLKDVFDWVCTIGKPTKKNVTLTIGQ